MIFAGTARAWHSVIMALFQGCLAAVLAFAGGCVDDSMLASPLHINELVSNNEGTWVDQAGETDDWIELVNVSESRVWLDDYVIEDGNATFALPHVPLGPRDRIVLWPDGEPEQGDLHLGFKLSSSGERIDLRDRDGGLRDRVDIPELAENYTFARFPDGTGSFEICRFATANRDNSAQCGPAPVPPIEDDHFAPYTWPTTPATGPLVVTELALRPAAFIEVLNIGSSPVSLSDYGLRIAPLAPGLPWPSVSAGTALSWPISELAPGARVVVPVTEADTAEVRASTEFEGVLSLFRLADAAAIGRIDFIGWPENAVLARVPELTGRHTYCQRATPGAPNDDCMPLASRPIGNRLHHLRTPGDFEALAAGGTELGLRSVKFIVDMESGDVVHFLNTDWDLHYTFVRELINHEPHLDRCDPEEGRLFRQGWTQFSAENYYVVDTRRYLLGTLVEYVGVENPVHTVEFVTGDRISVPQIRRAFFTVTSHLPNPSEWFLRPQDAEQVAKLRMMEGTVPIVGRNAPLIGITFQPLTPAVGYGVLRWVSAGDLAHAPLGRDTIVVTDDVPNDIPYVGGLITESLQTSLSHVNVLSRARGTPNMALRGAREDARVASLFDQLVRLEVVGGGFTLRAADPVEAEAFWRSREPTGPREVARLDPTVTGIVPIRGARLSSLPAIGAKAAQLGELGRIVSNRQMCPGPIAVPEDAFAIPMAYYLNHFQQSGAQAELASLEQRPEFRVDPTERGLGLERVRALITGHPVDASLLAMVEEAIQTRFGNERVRFRSSSNTEDLPSFNGAGLYTSTSVDLDNPERSLEAGFRTVWASLWNQRAYDEREAAHIDQSSVAMGILVHEAFLSEHANGVAVSRNIFDPTRGDMYYFNVQMGEASVANPAPGVTSDGYIYQLFGSPRTIFQSRSNLTDYLILSPAEMERAACTLAAIHTAFQPIIDPDRENNWFAMDIEFKLSGPRRELVVKQARPYAFADTDRPLDCREF